MTSTTSAARTATLEDDQYNERRHRTIIFSSSWVPQGGMRDLAHLSQVDCQFGSRPKPLQNNNLQFDAGLSSSHLAHFVHAHRRRKLWKNVRAGLTKALCSLARWSWEDAPDWFPLPKSGGFVRGARRDHWRLGFGHGVWECSQPARPVR